MVNTHIIHTHDRHIIIIVPMTKEKLLKKPSILSGCAMHANN